MQRKLNASASLSNFRSFSVKAQGFDTEGVLVGGFLLILAFIKAKGMAASIFDHF